MHIHRKQCYTQFAQKCDVIHNEHKMCITSKTMLYTNATKVYTLKMMLYTISITCVQHQKLCYTQLSQNVHNIENDVIHTWHKMCITSKTMLYTSVTKCVKHRKRCYTQLPGNLYNIYKTIARKFDKKTCYTGGNVLKMGCIKCFSIYTQFFVKKSHFFTKNCVLNWKAFNTTYFSHIFPCITCFFVKFPGSYV